MRGAVTGRYSKELVNLAGVYDVARRADICELCDAVERWLPHRMIMVGSGGSFSTARFAAYLHERASGQLARAATPLEIATGPMPAAGIACFSASGRNKDIVGAFRAAARAEAIPLGGLVLADQSPLQDAASNAHDADMVSISHPVFSDGFLAVASLLASALLLCRAYRIVQGLGEEVISGDIESLMASSTSIAGLDSLASDFDAASGRNYVSVLYTPSLAPAATDLESRFVEAALGALHIADIRNFGHGRHVWLAKRADQTGIIALIGDGLQTLGDKTLALVPDTVVATRVDFSGPPEVQALAGLVVGLYAAESAGNQAGIDPGKPGVPAFGRALYRLSPFANRVSQVAINQAAAIRRKGSQCDDAWTVWYREAIDRLNAARFDALVADYDGTLCDTRSRFDPLSQPLTDELTRLCEEGATLGIATGRGPSAGEALRCALPKTIHDRVLVGYYNGAEIRPLTDDTDPLLEGLGSTHPLLEALSAESVFDSGDIRANTAQISLTLQRGVCVEDAIGRARMLLRDACLPGEVVASSHSIDLLLKSQSKRALVDRLRRKISATGPILRLGDKGRWPGNDAELLDDPYGLSVDEVSHHPQHCWALSPAGIRGLPATLYYLRRLSWSKRGGRLRLTPGARA